MPAVFLPTHRREVERIAARPLVSRGGVVNPIADVFSGLECRLAAEATDVLFLAVGAAEIEQLARHRLPVHFAEGEVLAKRAGERPCELARVERRSSRRRTRGHGRDRVLVDAFIRSEEMNLVLDDRAADIEAGLITAVIGIRRQRIELKTLRCLADPPLRLE